jgi:hypothetical protein
MHSTRTSRLWRSVVAAAAIMAAVGASAASAMDDNPHAAQPFTIGVIGDMPYTSEQWAAFQGFLNAMSTDPSVQLAIHHGRVHQRYSGRAQQLRWGARVHARRQRVDRLPPQQQRPKEPGRTPRFPPREVLLGVICPTPRLCGALHIRGYAKSRTMQSGRERSRRRQVHRLHTLGRLRCGGATQSADPGRETVHVAAWVGRPRASRRASRWDRRTDRPRSFG